MKWLLILFCLISLAAQGQDCKINRDTDPFTKETKLSTGFISLQGASVTVDADSKEIDFFFTVNGKDKCFEMNTMAGVFFEGTKSKLNYRNNGSMNCDGYFHINFKNAAAPNTMLQRLTSQKIARMVFVNGNKEVAAITFTPDQQQFFMTMTNCLINEAKGLVK
jgi:hypothetical protein